MGKLPVVTVDDDMEDVGRMALVVCPIISEQGPVVQSGAEHRVWLLPMDMLTMIWHPRCMVQGAEGGTGD